MEASVCGAGPAGLLSAICLSQKWNGNCKIDVYDKRPAPTYSNKSWEDLSSSFYNLGLGERGITALMEFGAWEVVRDACILVPGRVDYQPGSSEPSKKMLTDKKYGTYVLPRDKLVSVLHQHVQEEYSDSIHLHYEHDVRPIMDTTSTDDDDSNVRIQVSNLDTDKIKIKDSDLVVACDGAARTFVRYFEAQDKKNKDKQDPISIVRFEDNNQRVFKSIHFQLPSDWERNLNYAVRSENSRVIFDALPVNLEGDYVGILLFRANDEMAEEQVDPQVFRQFLQQEIPQFSDFITAIESKKAARSKSSILPMFRYVTPRLHHGKNCVILGDSAKTVKPYFGLGCNSALEDVRIFGDCVDDASSIADAVSEFSSRRAKDIEVLVQVSASLDKPGLAGLFGFIFPLILDKIFYKLAPQVFAQNIIAMLQRDDITFQEVAARKRSDRIGQICCLSLLFATISSLVGSLSVAATTIVGSTSATIQ
ncbi:unnamed protein product [Cylindrotheca closterium]|uniref:FAD-binding domain-containing protein n=1 Tax=Cylindrotheca closterium TaxID=2856 RepID=A0AAD2JHU2_9STRA|nr:unnamed protein product [Cylindrotheca closterium]